MLKGILFNILFLFIAVHMSFASDDVLIDNFGKEKPKTFNSESMSLDQFSLRSQMQFKGENVINNFTTSYINLNTSITYQKGSNSYLVPFKKKIVLNRVTFNPNETLRNYSR